MAAKWRYSRYPPTVTRFTLVEMTLPLGHRFGWVKKRNILLPEPEGASLYQGICSCKWKGKWCPSRGQAIMDYKINHIREVEKQGTML